MGLLFNTGFTGTLTIVFIILKLLNKIDWPWIWVLSPLWIVAGIWIAVILIIISLALILG